MRTLVEIGESQIQALDALAQQQKPPRAALIRCPIDDFLAKRRSADEGDAFGCGVIAR